LFCQLEVGFPLRQFQIVAMIIYTHLNYRVLDRRLRRLEKMIPSRAACEPLSATVMREALRRLPELIAQLPPEIAANAREMSEDERQQIVSAAKEIPKAGEGEDSDVIYGAMVAIARKKALACYLSRGRHFAGFSDGQLKELCVSYHFLAFDYPWLNFQSIDATIECNLRGLPLPRELTESKDETRGNHFKIFGNRRRMHNTIKSGFFEIYRRIEEIDQAEMEEESGLQEEWVDEEIGVNAARTDDTKTFDTDNDNSS
jgi:hypothetical protein